MMININGTKRQAHYATWENLFMIASDSSEQSGEGAPPREDVDHELEDAARDEREYVRQRLSEDLGREPTQEELDEWLRQHTEGY